MWYAGIRMISLKQLTDIAIFWVKFQMYDVSFENMAMEPESQPWDVKKAVWKWSTDVDADRWSI